MYRSALSGQYGRFPPGGSGDQEVEIVCGDELGARTIVQCKQWNGTVESIEVQKLAGAKVMNEADRAILLTTGSFTETAPDQAARAGVECWDGQTLTGMARRGVAKAADD